MGPFPEKIVRRIPHQFNDFRASHHQTLRYTAGMLDSQTLLRGMLQVYVAFDWGDEIDLDRAQALAPAVSQSLTRRRRTPSSIAYRPAPLRYPLGKIPLQLVELGHFEADADAVLFDFGGVSITIQIPFELSPAALSRLAGSLSDPQPLIDAARHASTPLFRSLQPVIHEPAWSPLGEEYFVFQLPPGEPLPSPRQLLEQHAPWLAGLVRLESEPLSDEEIQTALQGRISYGLKDLLVADWSAAVLIDYDCEETLQTIGFANVQLLEYRHIDLLLDERLAAAYSTINQTLNRWLPLWRTQSRPLRRLGEVRIDANSLFERAGNALKMMGDQYLARVYRLISGRLHLADWEKSIRDSLDVVERAYQVVSEQSANFRMEFLEIIIILLIAFEIVWAFFH